MGTMKTAELRFNGHSIEDLSDLTGINANRLGFILEFPKNAALYEVAELAPRLGLSVEEYITAALS